MESPFPAPPLYDENVIVSLMEEIYKLLILICYLSASEVIFAPAGTGHAVNETVCRELGLDQRIISLMKRLPYRRSMRHYSKGIFPDEGEPTPLILIQEGDIRISRSPYNCGIPEDREECDGQLLLPSELPLCVGGSKDVSWILDVEENVIRRAHPMLRYGPRTSETTDRLQADDYRYCDADSAPDLLRDYVDGLRKLRWIGVPGEESITDLGPGQPDSYSLAVKRHLRKVLLEEFGWGTDHFDADDWGRNHMDVLDWVKDKPLEEEHVEPVDPDIALAAEAAEAAAKGLPLTIQQIRAKNHMLDKDRIRRGLYPLERLHSWIDQTDFTLLEPTERELALKTAFKSTARRMNEARVADGLPPLTHLVPWIDAHDADWLLENVEWWDLRPASYYPSDFRERKSDPDQAGEGPSRDEL